ncbi:MAG: helix-turn-helix domain-containing protein [Pseudonocardiaceae bacterium]
MAKSVPVDAESIEIGRRARMIRKCRGLSLDVVAGLTGITAPYLSMLERGQRGFNRRGLIEDLAGALGCSVTDLTGQPYLPVDRDTADALAAVPGIQVAFARTARSSSSCARRARQNASARELCRREHVRIGHRAARIASRSSSVPLPSIVIAAGYWPPPGASSRYPT